ncbi:tetratricopeptide repeat protein [Candidatus Woesearchaeota archaeon]|nr:tetratricopeptide repeat protein [Candidatus Woesearchaeota archaeon]
MGRAAFNHRNLVIFALVLASAILAIIIFNHYSAKPKYFLNDLSQAEMLRRNGDYKGAIGYYESVLKKDPDNYTALLGIGYSYLDLGNYKDALDKFNKTISIAPHNPDVYYPLGVAYYLMEDYQNAVTWLREYHRLRQDSKAASYMLADTYNALGLYDEALELSKKNLEMDTANPHFYRQMAMSTFFKKNYSDALRHAQMANQIEDMDSNHLALGAIYLATNQKEMSLSEFEAANKVSKGNSAFAGLSISYYLLGDNNNAEHYMIEAKKYERHSFTLSFFGFALLNIGQYAKAIEIFNMASANKPNYYLPYKGIAVAYRELGNRQEALKNIGKAI